MFVNCFSKIKLCKTSLINTLKNFRYSPKINLLDRLYGVYFEAYTSQNCR